MSELERLQAELAASRAELGALKEQAALWDEGTRKLRESADRLKSDISASRAEVERLKTLLVQAAIPLEVIAAQSAQFAYEEITEDLQSLICDEVVPAIRAALSASAPQPTSPEGAQHTDTERLDAVLLALQSLQSTDHPLITRVIIALQDYRDPRAAIDTAMDKASTTKEKR